MICDWLLLSDIFLLWFCYLCIPYIINLLINATWIILWGVKFGTDEILFIDLAIININYAYIFKNINFSFRSRIKEYDDDHFNQ